MQVRCTHMVSVFYHNWLPATHTNGMLEIPNRDFHLNNTTQLFQKSNYPFSTSLTLHQITKYYIVENEMWESGIEKQYKKDAS